MKENNNIKDWSELLREKAGSFAGDKPDASFAQIKEKMLAAAAAQKAAAPRRTMPAWLKYAAAVAVVAAGGVFALTNWPAHEARIAEVTPIPDEVTAAESQIADSTGVTSIAIDPTHYTIEDAASSDAPSASSSIRRIKAASVKNQQIAEAAEAAEPTDQNNTDNISTENAESSSPAANTNYTNSNSTDGNVGGETGDSASADTPATKAAPAQPAKVADPFAEPVKPLRKQIKRFSLGASGFLANNSIGNGKATPRNLSGDMVAYIDKDGKVFYSNGAPTARYYHSAPISGGISLRYNFNHLFYAETGARFTYLHTWISPSGASQDLLYAGIPVGFGCNFADLSVFTFYGSVYGMPSKCVMGHASVNFPSNDTKLSDIPLMWSAGASLGATYNITRTIGLFAEPTVSYYFPDSNAPQTLYKENPWYFTLNVGVRFNLD